MTLQVTELRKRLRAAGMTTFVGLVASVSANVLLEVRKLRKLPLANFAAIGFDAEMNSRVLRQVRGVGEGFGALRTFVGLGFAHVSLRVHLHLGFAAEDLQGSREIY